MPATRSDLVDLELQRHAETAKALGVSADGDLDNIVWLPKSQVEFETNPRNSSLVTVTLPQWLAEEKGLV